MWRMNDYVYAYLFVDHTQKDLTQGGIIKYCITTAYRMLVCEIKEIFSVESYKHFVQKTLFIKL